MPDLRFVHWREDDAWLGYLEDYPDQWTQGATYEDLLEHLRDLHLDPSGNSGQVQ